MEQTATILSARGVDTATQAWLEQFAHCVRARDFAAAQQMFDTNVSSFGTWTGRMDGLDDLVSRQWSNVWPKTTGFEIELQDAFGGSDVSGSWAAVTWKSHALNGDGSRGFERRGRATFVFRRDAGKLLAVHTHFSMEPAGRL